MNVPKWMLEQLVAEFPAIAPVVESVAASVLAKLCLLDLYEAGVAAPGVTGVVAERMRGLTIETIMLIAIQDSITNHKGDLTLVAKERGISRSGVAQIVNRHRLREFVDEQRNRDIVTV